MEEISLGKIWNESKRYFKILIIFIVVGCLIGFAYSYTKYKMEPKKGTSTILIDKNTKSISTLVESYNTDTLNSTFDASSNTITITAIGKNEDEIKQNVSSLEEKLKNELPTKYDVQKFDEIKALTITDAYTIADIVKATIIGLIIAIVVYITMIFIIETYKTTTDEYELYQATKLKVLGNVSNSESKKEELNLIRANIDIKKNAKNLIFLKADNKVNQTDLIKDLAKSYTSNKENVLIITNNLKKSTNIIAIKENATKKEITDTLSKMGKKYERILIDGESLTEDYRTTILTELADSAIIVARAEKTSVNEMLKTKQFIEDIKDNAQGIVLS